MINGNLSLTFIPGDAVVLTLPDGRTIEVCVTRCEQGRAGVSIAAPKEIPIQRKHRTVP